jgi:hypothetical protein
MEAMTMGECCSMSCLQKFLTCRNQVRFVSAGVLTVVLVLLVSVSSKAQELDGDAIKQLALQGKWVADDDWGIWSWAKDGTVCLRLLGPNSDCADKGTWAIDGDVMCYELGWWGESYDMRSNCFTVEALGDGKYEALHHGGAMVSTFIVFSIVE